MVASELGNIVIDREDLVSSLCETKHDVNDLMGRLGAVELIANKLVSHLYTDEEKSDTIKLKFDLYYPRGVFQRIFIKLATISNKLESEGGVGVQGYAFSNYMDSVQWFKDHNGITDILVDGVAMLNSMTATMIYTYEANRAKEADNNIDMG